MRIPPIVHIENKAPVHPSQHSRASLSHLQIPGTEIKEDDGGAKKSTTRVDRPLCVSKAKVIPCTR